MKTSFILLMAVCLLAPLGCGTSMSVKQDWDPDYRFDGIDAYAWLPLHSTQNIGEMRLKRLVDAIDSELAAKGLRLTADDPDVLLVLHVMSEAVLDLAQYGYSPGWSQGNSKMTDLGIGTLMVDVVDAKSRDLVWRAVADGGVDPSASPADQEKRFAKLAKKLFENFPPQQ
jgi:hypothetical protein